uniref:FAS1 domain-containing protein n=1 Tax=Ananas comosus var. bracteatus TaxID=296719 RepID=A0A6V7Q8E4_ANACO|nr:unnamed protein product [Ananas comosus var. bracteatus]
MSKSGCAAFAELLLSTADVEKTFNDSVDGGLTVFCPIDAAVKAFAPKFKNLTAAHKTAILLYHGVPVYYSMQMLKSNNGIVNTLATDGGAAKNYNYTLQNDGETVTLETKVVTATVMKTAEDSDPLGVYTIDKFLQPREMFKAVAEEPAPAPKGPKKKKGKNVASPPAPAGPEEAPADDATADDDTNGCVRLYSSSNFLVGAVTAALLSVVTMMV